MRHAFLYGDIGDVLTESETKSTQYISYHVKTLKMIQETNTIRLQSKKLKIQILATTKIVQIRQVVLRTSLQNSDKFSSM